jgi:hypothetical protein
VGPRADLEFVAKRKILLLPGIKPGPSSPSLYRLSYLDSTVIINKFKGQGMQHESGRGGMHIGYWWESQKERDHLEDQDVDGWTILKWILER